VFPPVISIESTMSNDPRYTAYLESQRRAAQWTVFLRAVAQALQSRLDVDELRQTMRAAGMQAAQELALPECETLADIEAAANRHWSQMGWGCVALSEQPDCLRISHAYAPFAEAFGAEPPDWLGSFLEGVYQQWFLLLGAGNALLVRFEGRDENGILNYRFGR
jgi:hypothetical protein